MSVSPWHQLCTLREDVRSGTLTLAEFAADLNDVRTGDAPAVYRDPAMFFDRTYPTYRMKVLTRDVLLRLAGQGGRPVLQLQVAYGGGKTHTLIALLHLAERRAGLAEHKTVREFFTFAGLSQLPQARVALLPCDKFDIKEGLEVYGPDGKTRRVRTLWGALAYQLAGDVGYARLKEHDEDFIVPAEPLLVDLLRAPVKEGLGALVLVDEAVWYYRSLVNENPRLLGTIKDFYQVLTQAVSKVDRAAMVAGLMASKVEASDQTGVQCLQALEDIFRRIAEPVEPVAREDVAEVLRRRLFERVPGEAERRPAVDAMMAAMQRLPLREAQRDQSAYERFMDSYPFHPDLINVLYQKWTQQMRGFQRTRGALRLLAYALRDSRDQDPSPIVGPGALLSYASESRDGGGLSAALEELVDICEEKEKWTPILIGELEKAREIQAGLPTLKAREIEQAVVATFLHSQPIGQRAAPSELLTLLAHPSVDAAALEEGLRKWRGISWFLVENPDVWQVSTTPNLTHMHVQAIGWLNEQEIDDELKRRIRAVPTLKIADPGVEVHTLPQSPRDISDDPQLHYLILEPECAMELGKPLPAAVEAYFNERTGPQDPRIYRNNILALVPEVSRVAGLREQVRRWLAWGRLEQPEVFKLLTDPQKKELPKRKQEAASGLPEAVVGAYNILVAVDETGQVRAQPLRTDTTAGGTPFERVKFMLTQDERLVTTSLDPDLILPGSYLELWREDETARRATDLRDAFGQFPRLPRLLRPESLFDTLARGVREGVLVLRLPRADGSIRTWWRISPDHDTLRRSEMEVQPANLAVLHDLEPELLELERVDSLWPVPTGPLALGGLHAFFDGVRAPRLAAPDVLDAAVRTAVQQGTLMARLDDSSLFREPIPDGPLPMGLELLPPPPPIHGADLTPQALPEAWEGDQVTLQAIADALAARHGYSLPWTLLSQGVNEALQLHLFERVPESGPWPCSPAVADQVRFRRVEKIHLPPETVAAALGYTSDATPALRAVKETIEARFLGREVPTELFVSAVQAAIAGGQVVEADEWRQLATAPDPLAVRIRLPAAALLAEATLDPMALQKLAERVERLLTIAPQLAFSFRVILSAEGQRPDAETLERLNALLAEIHPEWKLGSG
jgi:hypothetical protein